MFITPAMAQTAAPGGSNIILQLMPFILIFAIMYFLIIRPQQKRLKAHREMVSNVKRGDTVVTAGGLVGKVASVVNDDEIRVDIADGVRVNVVRNTLSEVRPKGEVRGAEKAAKKTEQIEEDAEETAADEQDAPAAETAKSANGAAKKPGARNKSRQASASGGTRKSGGASKSGTSTRKPRSRAKSGNGASAGGSKETGGDNA